MLNKQLTKQTIKLVICCLLFTIHYSLFTVHCFACTSPSSVTAVIGSPANGTNNCIDISWSAVASAISYQLTYSTDNLNWHVLYTGSEFSFHHICGQVPNAPFYYKVSASINGIVFCTTPTSCTPFPIYTACNAPILKLSNSLTYTLQLTFMPETPVINPLNTVYSIYCKTNSKYVQAIGTLGSTEVFQTKAQWGTVTVVGLNPLTQYCFYAIARNSNGDIRYNLTDNILVPLQTFDASSSVSNYNCASYTNHTKWNLCPGGSSIWTYSDTIGCPGGGISYESKGNAFVYSPYFTISGFQYILVSFNISNSFNSLYSKNAFQMALYNDSAYVFTPLNMNFDRSRHCEYAELSFSTSGYSVNHNEILLTTYLFVDPISNYNVSLDNITVTGQSITLVCGTTRQICTAPKIAINGSNQSKCIGQQVTFTTTFSGTDTLFYQWRKNNKNITGATYSQFSILNSQLSDSGNYSCFINNFCGSATSANVKLSVGTPITVQILPDDPVKCSGDSIEFKIALTGTTFQSYIWEKGNNVISGASSSVYLIMNISTADEDIYSCKVSNGCNSDSSNTILHVNTPASINITPLIITKFIGDSILFSLSPSGTSPFSYQWYKNDTAISGAIGDSLYIKPILNSDAGVYTCNISNICGSTMNNISTLIVNNGNLYTLSGTVTYDNTVSTPMKLTTLYIYLNSDSLDVKDSANTDSIGFYTFSKILPGEYFLKIKTLMEWKGVNPVDALLINRYYIKLYSFTDALRKRAADVNNDGKINPVDALLVNRRYVKLINKFTLPDWLFDNQSIIITKDTIYNIKAICAGDVKGIY